MKGSNGFTEVLVETVEFASAEAEGAGAAEIVELGGGAEGAGEASRFCKTLRIRFVGLAVSSEPSGLKTDSSG